VRKTGMYKGDLSCSGANVSCACTAAKVPGKRDARDNGLMEGARDGELGTHRNATPNTC
jgi:hypothetical protein